MARNHPKDGFVDRLQKFGFPPSCYPSYKASDFYLGGFSLPLNTPAFAGRTAAAKSALAQVWCNLAWFPPSLIRHGERVVVQRVTSKLARSEIAERDANRGGLAGGGWGFKQGPVSPLWSGLAFPSQPLLASTQGSAAARAPPSQSSYISAAGVAATASVNARSSPNACRAS